MAPPQTPPHKQQPGLPRSRTLHHGNTSKKPAAALPSNRTRQQKQNPPNPNPKDESDGSKMMMLNRNRCFGPRKEVVEWKGVGEDHMIVWPPMLLVQDTRSHMDETGKWVGMGKKNLLTCFKHHEIRKVENAYGPAGHCGVSLLIFDSSALGYLEAESLHRQFVRESRGKNEWETRQGHTHPAGERLLYGYMATEGDMELLNRHSKGKQKHKFEMESYKRMVLNPLKKMIDNDEKLHLREIEIETIRRRANEKSAESKQEIDYLDKYHMDTIKQLSDDLEKAITEREEIQKSLPLLPNCRKELPSVA